MTWRFQPVWQRTKAGKVYSVCEVYLDKAGRLKNWTETPSVTPSGTDGVEDLRGSLVLMLHDAYRWEPVEFSKLKTGMLFKRRGCK